MDNNVLTEREAARFLGVAPRTLNNWRYFDKGPAYIRIGSRAVRYLPTDLDAYRQQHRNITLEQN